jgi:hypothetical protein
MEKSSSISCAAVDVVSLNCSCSDGNECSFADCREPSIGYSRGDRIVIFGYNASLPGGSTTISATGRFFDDQEIRNACVKKGEDRAFRVHLQVWVLSTAEVHRPDWRLDCFEILWRRIVEDHNLQVGIQRRAQHEEHLAAANYLANERGMSLVYS